MDEETNITLEDNTIPEEAELTAGGNNPISLIPNHRAIPLSLDGQKKRAAMANYALQEESPGLEGLYLAIKEGRESAIRERAANLQSIERSRRATEIIGQLASGEVFPEQRELDIQALSKLPPPNPETVLEEMWSANYTKELITAPSKPVKEMLDQDAEKALAKTGFLNNLVSKQKFAESYKQYIDKRYEDLPWIDTNLGKDKLGSWLMTFIPLANDLGTRNAVKGSEDFTNSILPGSNLSEVTDFLYMLNGDDFVNAFKATTEQLWAKSPHMAQNFVDAVVSRPASSEFTDNLFGVIDAVTAIPGAKIARGAKAATKASVESIEAAPIAITKEIAEAGKNVWLTPEQITNLNKGLEVNLAKAISDDARARTVFIPHQMPPEALRKAQDAFPESGSYPSSRNNKNASASSLEAPEGLPERPIIKYSVGDQTFNVNKNTVFVTPEEANKLGFGIDSLEETPKRVFRNKDGNLEVSEQVNGRWTPTGEVLEQTANPKAGDIALSLGPSRKSMGTEYWSDFRREEISGITRSAAYEDATPRNLTLQQWTDLQGSLGRSVFPDEMERIQQNFDAYLASGARAVNTAPASSLADTAKFGIKSDMEGTLNTLGRIDEAATIGASTRLQRAITAFDPLRETEELGKQAIGLLRPNAFWGNPAELSRERADRLADSTLYSARLLEAGVGPRVMKHTEEEIKAAIDLAKRELDREFNHVEDGIVDIKYFDGYQASDNSHYVSIRMGQPNGLPFDDVDSARNTMNMVAKIVPNDYQIDQVGDKYFVTMTKNVSFDDPMLRNLVIPTNNITPRSWWNNLFKGTRSADDTTSEIQRGARKVATNAQQAMKGAIEDAFKSIKITSKEVEELNILLNQGRFEKDANGRGGAFYNTAQRVEEEYIKRFNKAPTEDFIAAYDMYKKIHEYEGMLSKANEIGHMKSWGAKNFSGNLWKAGEMKNVPNFLARQVDDFDLSIPTDRVIYISDSENKLGKQVWTRDYQNNINGLKAEIDAKLDAGYKIYQLYSPYKKPLADSLGHKGEIHFVLSNTMDTGKRLDWSAGFEWRQGVHHMYQYKNFIAQPRISTDGKGQLTHFGDHVFRSGGATEAEARAWATKYETARGLMNAGDDVALDAYVRANLPETMEDFKKLFTGDNALDKDLPIVFTREGEDTLRTNPDVFTGPKWTDPNGRTIRSYGVDPSNPEGMINRAFMQDRADQALQYPVMDNGTLKLTNAPQIDPFPTIQRSMGQVIRNRYFDDYKLLASESFLKEFGKWIDTAGKNVTLEDMLRNPMYWINDAKPVKELGGTELEAFKAQQRNLKNFLGMRSEIGQQMDYIQRQMENMAYNKFGAEKVNNFLANEFVSGTLLPTIKDPTKFTRAAAFHMNMGFFNPIHLFVQSQQLVHITALNPKQAWASFVGATLWNKGLRHTEDAAIIDKYATWAEKFGGWKKEDFIEAIEHLKRSGTDRVGKEQALLNDVADPKLIQGTLGTIIDKGPVFFNMAEKYSRNVAFLSAFREWRLANPGKAMDQGQYVKLINRYDDLTLNMTRASNSALQEGIFSVPTQFLTFNQRLAEQMLGKRLTKMEKGRVLAVNSAMYGIPTGISGATMFGFIPGLEWATGLDANYDDIRKYALDNGLMPKNFAGKALMDGIIDTSIAAITGKDTTITKRYGPGSSTLLKDIKDTIQGTNLSPDKTVLKMLTGPSGQFIGDVASNLMPFTKSLFNAFSDKTQYPVVIEDFISMIDEIKTASNAVKWAYAANTQKWMSKSGTYVGDVTGVDGFLNALLGVSPQKFEDMYLKNTSLKAARKASEDAIYKASKELGRASEELAKGNTEAYHERLQRARHWSILGDLTPDGEAEAVARSANRNRSQFDQLNQQFELYDPRRSKQIQRFQERTGDK